MYVEINMKKVGNKLVTGTALGAILLTGFAGTVSANEGETQGSPTNVVEKQEVVPYNVVSMDHVATIVKGLEVYKKPKGFDGSEKVDINKYIDKDYHVTEKQDVEGVTWYKIENGDKTLGWVKEGDLEVKKFLEIEDQEDYDNVGKIKDDIEGDFKIWKEPRYTKGASFVADLDEYKNKPLQIVEKAVTVEDEEETTWYKFKHNGGDVGWLPEDALEIGKHDIAYIFQKGDTLELIEETFDLTKKEIQERNEDLDVDNLKEGDKIKLFIGTPLPKLTFDDGKMVSHEAPTSTVEFINYLAPYADQIKEQGVLPSVAIAQAIIESRSGQSGLALNDNNLFGIKGTYNGYGASYQTKEYYGGQYVTVQSTFRSYPSWEASILDHAKFLNDNSRYHAVIGETDYHKFTKGLQNAGYATSPTYAQTLDNVIEAYGLYQFD